MRQRCQWPTSNRLPEPFMPEAEVDRQRIAELIAGLGLPPDVEPDIEILVVHYSGDPQLHDAEPSELLAWFVYVLGTSGCIVLPEGFGGHGLIGVAGRGPRSNDEVIIELRYEDGPAVATTSLELHLLLEDRDLHGRERIERGAQVVANEASALIPAAMAAGRH